MLLDLNTRTLKSPNKTPYPWHSWTLKINQHDAVARLINLKIAAMQESRREDFAHIEDLDRRIFDLKKDLRLTLEAKAADAFIYYCRHGRFPNES